jgi:hypothetical protein
MKNFKNTVFLILLFISIGSAAQEGLILKQMEQDSAQIQLERQIELRQLISGKTGNDFMIEKIELPKFDYKSEFTKRYSQNLDIYSFNSLPRTGFSPGMMNPFYSPFYQNGMVLSEGAWKLSDKFTLGGFSYGANSMMSAPLPNQMNKFDSYGSTLFMQYKVSKNFKIETRVNVQQRGMYPGF